MEWMEIKECKDNLEQEESKELLDHEANPERLESQELRVFPDHEVESEAPDRLEIPDQLVTKATKE